MRDEPLDSVARQLCTTVETLRECELFGWIYTINKNGRCLLPRQLMQKTKMFFACGRIANSRTTRSGRFSVLNHPPGSIRFALETARIAFYLSSRSCFVKMVAGYSLSTHFQECNESKSSLRRHSLSRKL